MKTVNMVSWHETEKKKERKDVYVYAFSRRFYPKQLTNEDITSYIKKANKKLTINYIAGTH